MSYMYSSEELAYLVKVCEMLDALGEPPDKTYLEVKFISYDEPIGTFSDELGEWRYIENIAAFKTERQVDKTS